MAPDKYPRTWHLSISPGQHREDRQHADDSHLVGVEVAILEKLDGSGVSLHRGGLYARSKAGPPTHPSYDPLKALHAQVAWQLPTHLSLFGEWLHTVHTIVYPQLPAEQELQTFAVRDERDGSWLGLDEVERVTAVLGLTHAPVLERGRFDTVAALHAAVTAHAGAPSVYGPEREGVVVRTVSRFPTDRFHWQVAKWVRDGHVAGERWERHGIRRHQANSGQGRR